MEKKFSSIIIKIHYIYITKVIKKMRDITIDLTIEEVNDKIDYWNKVREEMLLIPKDDVWYTDIRPEYSKILYYSNSKTKTTYGFDLNGEYGFHYMDKENHRYLVKADIRKVEYAVFKELKRIGVKHDERAILLDRNTQETIKEPLMFDEITGSVSDSNCYFMFFEGEFVDVLKV